MWSLLRKEIPLGVLDGSGPSCIHPLKDSFPGHLVHFQYGQPGWSLFLSLVTENLHNLSQLAQRPGSVGAVYGCLVGVLACLDCCLGERERGLGEWEREWERERGCLLRLWRRWWEEREREREREHELSVSEEDEGVDDLWCRLRRW